jgi:protein-L-isoaspartate(D-aspartate) O-methyltransferase
MDQSDQPSDVDLISRRMRMVDEQLFRRGVNDAAVLAAMRTVPRHRFVRPEDIDQAYGDHPLSIGCEQTISQPYIVGSMTEELQLDGNSRVLEIGTGWGYQTAVLAEIVRHVFTIERIPELLRAANDRLKELEYTNFTSMLGDGALGWEQHAPFDGILVAAAGTDIPPALLVQLADPGRMVIPIGRAAFNQDLVLIEKCDGRVTQRTLYGVRFVPLRTD